MIRNSSPVDIGSTARTWLFVPGSRPERFTKAAAAQADVVVVDLEDAVGVADKDEARRHAVTWLRGSTVTAAVRVNALGTPWHDADVASLRQLPPQRPVLVMLPKAEDARAIHGLRDALPDGSAVAALVETARGVLRVAEIAGAACRLVFGSYDLAADLTIDPENEEALRAARSALVLASAAAGMTGPVDGVTGDVQDTARLIGDVQRARAMGFAGKLCIHPAQVETARDALAPSADEIAWATRIVEAVTSQGDGVLVVDGRMVDAPVLDRAHRLLGLRRPPFPTP